MQTATPLGDVLRALGTTYRPRSREEKFEAQRDVIIRKLKRRAEGKDNTLPEHFVDLSFNYYYDGLADDLKKYFEEQKISVTLEKRIRYLKSCWFVLHFDWSEMK